MKRTPPSGLGMATTGLKTRVFDHKVYNYHMLFLLKLAHYSSHQMDCSVLQKDYLNMKRHKYHHQGHLCQTHFLYNLQQIPCQDLH